MKYYFRCPKCGSDEQFVKADEGSSGLGCLLLVFGGFIPALIYADHHHGRVQCVKCLHTFRQPSMPSSPLAIFASWVLACLLIPTVLSAFFFWSEDLAGVLPSLPVLALIEETVTMQPRVAAYLIAVVFVLVILTCWAVAVQSNYRYRKTFSAEFRTKAISADELNAGDRPGDERPQSAFAKRRWSATED